MRSDTQSINIEVPVGELFEMVADPRRLPLFAGPNVDVVTESVKEMEQLNSASAVFHGTPMYQAPRRLASGVHQLLASRRWTVLESAAD